MKKSMRLRNVLIVVNDIERSKKFYHDLFGLETVLEADDKTRDIFMTDFISEISNY